jgi:hypothetical protein
MERASAHKHRFTPLLEEHIMKIRMATRLTGLAFVVSMMGVSAFSVAHAQDAPGAVQADALPHLGTWSLDMAAGVAASPDLDDDMREIMVGAFAGTTMVMTLAEGGVYSTVMTMDGNPMEQSGTWQTESHDGMVLRISTRSSADSPPIYMTLTLDTADSGTCLMESDGYPVPMQRVP